MTDAIDKAFKDFESDNKSHSDIDNAFDQFDASSETPISARKSTTPIPGADTATDYERTKQFEKEQSLLGKAKLFGSDIAETYKRKVIENFKAGREAASTALSDIGSNLPASGIGKSVMGNAGMIASPLTGAYDTAGEIINKLLPSNKFGEMTDLSGNVISKSAQGASPGERATILPFGGLPIAKGTQSVKAAMPTNKAMRILTESIGEENLPEAVKRLESNPRLTVMDVSNPTLQRAQKLVVEPGPQQSILEKFTTGQRNTAKSTVENIYSELGQPVNVKEKLDELKANARKVGSEQINPAIAEAKPVDLTDVLSHIQNKVKPGINSIISAGETLPSTAVQNRLAEIKNYISNDKSVMTDPQRLHQIQSALRIEAEGLLSSSVGSERTLGREIMGVRSKIVDAIDEASGGKYKPALSNFRDEKQITDAFHKGMDITSNRKGKFEDLPEFWDEWINNAKSGEIEAAKEGALTELRRQRATVKNAALKGETVPEIEFNKEKLGLLFGKEQAEKMSRELRDERDIAIRNQKLYENSQTAMRLKADEDINVRQPHTNPLGMLPAAIVEGGSAVAGSQFGTYVPGLGLAVYGANKGLMYGVNKLRKALDEKKNVELTNLMTATGEERQAMLEHFKRKITENQSQSGSNIVRRINALNSLQKVIAP